MTYCREFLADGQQEALASATENVGPDPREEHLCMFILEDLSTAVQATRTCCLSLHTAARCVPALVAAVGHNLDFSSYHLHDQLTTVSGSAP